MLQRENLFRLVILIVLCQAVSCKKEGDSGPSPVISDFSPTEGIGGDLVTITGANFSLDLAKNRVTFGNDILAEVTSASATKITVKVPATAVTGQISVTTNGKSASSANTFRILGTPTITSLSAGTGRAGDVITINGSGFSSDKTQNTVRIGQATAEVTQASATQITAVIPPDAFGGNGIILTTPGGFANYQFGVHMTITGFTPISGPLGTRIKITGTGLSVYFKVTFNGKLCPSISSTPNELVVAAQGAIGATNTLTITEDVLYQGDTQQSVTTTTTKTFAISDAPPVQMASFPGTTRFVGATGFAIGAQLFFGLGTATDAPNTALNDFWNYNSSNDTWTRVADFPGGARYYATSFSFGGKGYIISGITKPSGSAVYQKDVWQYDPLANSWKQLGNFPGTERSNATCFIVGQYVYFGMGFSNGNCLKDFWRYDPVNDSWQQKSDFIDGTINDQAGFSIGNLGFVVGGTKQNLSTVKSWEYDPSKDTWVALQDDYWVASPFSNGWSGRCVGFTFNGIGYAAKGPVLYQLIPDVDSNQITPYHISSWVGVQTPPSNGENIDGCYYLTSGTNAFIWYGASAFWKFTPPN